MSSIRPQTDKHLSQSPFTDNISHCFYQSNLSIWNAVMRNGFRCSFEIPDFGFRHDIPYSSLKYWKVTKTYFFQIYLGLCNLIKGPVQIIFCCYEYAQNNRLIRENLLHISCIWHYKYVIMVGSRAVFRIRIWIRMFLGLQNPDP